MECTDPCQFGENTNPVGAGSPRPYFSKTPFLCGRTKFPNVSRCEVHPPWARTRFVERDHLGLLPSFRMSKNARKEVLDI